eukprot:TRINITY_DN4639_c0_g1_i1.p1 TRINITY_DN4639_c0_g1~~TRINITY_DN4639_c0_g1_i1.p1  ORF type:complete len:511 (-),score=46.41 TRINITY_DN4639_c0_g1_i1:390-1922(-)
MQRSMLSAANNNIGGGGMGVTSSGLADKAAAASRLFSHDSFEDRTTASQSPNLEALCNRMATPISDSPIATVTVSVEGVGFQYQLTQDDIRKVFSRYGEVINVHIALDGTFAIVSFALEDVAQKAVVELDGRLLSGINGRLRVSIINAASLAPPGSPPYSGDETEVISYPLSGTSASLERHGSFSTWTAKSDLHGGGSNESLMMTERNYNNLKSNHRYPNPMGTRQLSPNLLHPSSTTSNNNHYSSAAISTPNSNLETRALVTTASHLPLSPPDNVTPDGRPIRKYTCRFEVGIENEREFQVARRIIGTKGSNMKRIVNFSGAKLRLRGKGSGFLEGQLKQEAQESLHLCISCCEYSGYRVATQMVAELLLSIYDDHLKFCQQRNKKLPAHSLHIREQPMVATYMSSSSNQVTKPQQPVDAWSSPFFDFRAGDRSDSPPLWGTKSTRFLHNQHPHSEGLGCEVIGRDASKQPSFPLLNSSYAYINHHSHTHNQPLSPTTTNAATKCQVGC